MNSSLCIFFLFWLPQFGNVLPSLQPAVPQKTLDWIQFLEKQNQAFQSNVTVLSQENHQWRFLVSHPFYILNLRLCPSGSYQMKNDLIWLATWEGECYLFICTLLWSLLEVLASVCVCALRLPGKGFSKFHQPRFFNCRCWIWNLIYAEYWGAVISSHACPLRSLSCGLQ